MQLPSQQEPDKAKIDLPGYPLYPVTEDVYNQGQVVKNIDPEDVSKTKEPIKTDADENRELAFEDDFSGSDLDVPGSELDDEDEAIGSEDEENNYYSLGGDNHDNLEEDNGD
ncbi:MAG: hypothetical protein H7101_03205 [Deinococcales bacterium]|nr:hypothetical protein [Chitinophagaceae bacterium]